MAIRNIVTVEDSILTKKSRPIEKFDERLWRLLDDMKETMYRANGVGLAAVQVGILRRAAIVDCGDGYLELINPEIVESEGEQYAEEGCLSIPGRVGTTLRPDTVKVKARDRNGERRVYEARDLKARCFCHEIDHLDGILFTRRVVRGETKE